MLEQWRPVEEFDGLYEVSNLGGFRSTHTSPPRPVKSRPNPDGYLIVTASIKGVLFTRKLHRLVCRAFHGPGNALHREVAHLDGDRANARADNLKWCGKVENHSHKRLHGTHQAGVMHPRALLSPEAAQSIRSRRHITARELGREYGVSRHTIYDVWQGIRWASFDQAQRA